MLSWISKNRLMGILKCHSIAYLAFHQLKLFMITDISIGNMTPLKLNITFSIVLLKHFFFPLLLLLLCFFLSLNFIPDYFCFVSIFSRKLMEYKVTLLDEILNYPEERLRI